MKMQRVRVGSELLRFIVTLDAKSKRKNTQNDKKVFF